MTNYEYDMLIWDEYIYIHNSDKTDNM